MKDRRDPPTVFSAAKGEAISPARVIRLLRSFVETVTGITPEVRARFSDESLCRRCGTCCHLAIKVNDKMVLLRDLPCKYLARNEDGRAMCKIYHLREMTGFCHKIETASIRKELYPPDCPYVDGLPHYGGKVELPPGEFEKIVPILRNIFKGFPRPEAVTKSAWEKFIRGTLGL